MENLSVERIYLGFADVFPHLGGAGSACAHVARPEHLLVAEDAASGVLLVV